MADPTAPNYANWVTEQLENLARDIRALQSADGTQTFNAVDKVRQLIVAFRAELDAYLATLDVYTKAETDSRIASPPTGSAVTGDVTATGNVAADGNVTADANMSAGGTITAAGVVISPGSRAAIATTGYAGAWLNGDGTLCISPSSLRYKTDIEPWMPPIQKLLDLRAVMFRYKTAAPDGAKQLGFIAEEMEALGFWEFLFYELTDDDELVVQGVNYDRITVALLVLAQWQDERIRRIEDHLGL